MGRKGSRSRADDTDARITYRDVGVDTARISRIHSMIGSMIAGTHDEHVISGYGHYAGLISIDDERVLAMHTDGVGSKVIVASLSERYDTIGIDCIAMNANDIICVGATPVAFVDYLALRRPEPRMVEEIMNGLAHGAREASVSIVGGEVAVLPDLLADELQGMKEKEKEKEKDRSRGRRGSSSSRRGRSSRSSRGRYGDGDGDGHNTFDLAGTIVGIARKDELILGESIAVGDTIVGIASNGLHSNGYTLARRVLLSRYRLDERIDELGSTLVDELLRPTRIYVRPVLDVIRSIDVHGIAHVTGGAFTKLIRLNDNVRFILDSMPEPPEVFRLIQKHAGIDEKEMYSTFNMGIGMCIITAKGDEDAVISICRSHGMDAMVVGRVDEGKGVYIKDTRLV
ncbi:MAG: phosphoribosylformylglycinamidine cyclo-ligase [Candidatus Nitrosocaldus sp.]|nr:phosphoribosylformylglycinamidine cyclo-ligase [Candidatus Nitrosocaldus sp.]MDW8275960.1 phosphoribosylformylglycinamidine cyclo-ligase [Candidatus Nitrosocaldus sp.]